MNFTEVHIKPQAPSRLLKTDFSEEEKAWRDYLPTFIFDMAVANVECEPCCGPDDSSDKSAKPPEQKIVQNTEQNPKEHSAQIVESTNVGERHSEPANEATQPKEQCLSNDPFGDDATSSTTPISSDADDIFGFEAPKPSAAKVDSATVKPQPTKPEEKKEIAPASKADDDFGLPEPTKDAVKAPLAEAKQMPTPVAQNETPSATVVPPAAESEAVAEASGVGDYAEMMEVVSSLLEKTAEINLNINMNDYTVHIDLDAWREDATILARRGAEIASKRDSLHAVLLQIRPAASDMDEVIDWLEDVGANCFEGSSEKKRLAKMKLGTKEFWIRHAKLKRVSKELKETYDHLNRQWDTISRLIGVDQDRNKRREFSRGAAPWEEAAAETSHTDSEDQNRKMSQPLNPERFKNMDSFPENPPKIQPANAKKHVKGEIDF